MLLCFVADFFHGKLKFLAKHRGLRKAVTAFVSDCKSRLKLRAEQLPHLPPNLSVDSFLLLHFSAIDVTRPGWLRPTATPRLGLIKEFNVFKNVEFYEILAVKRREYSTDCTAYERKWL